MDAVDLAGAIHDRLYDLHGDDERWDDGTSIANVVLEGAHVFVTTSDARIFRVTVEPWP